MNIRNKPTNEMIEKVHFLLLKDKKSVYKS